MISHHSFGESVKFTTLARAKKIPKNTMPVAIDMRAPSGAEIRPGKPITTLMAPMMPERICARPYGCDLKQSNALWII